MKHLKIFKFFGANAFIVGTIFVLMGTSSAAAFNQNDVMDNAVFNDYNSMNAGQINSFLNSFSGSCISTNHGFSAPDPTGYNPSAGFTYGSSVSAGQVIYDAAQAYQLNPQVLLATIQKEQSLVSGGGGCSTESYAAAAGYGCPDSGTDHSYSGVDLYSINGNMQTTISSTCVNTSAKVGFSQQIIHAAWLLEYDMQRSEGHTNWAIITGNWVNTDDLTSTYSGFMTQGCLKQAASDSSCTNYDGYATIDGSSVYMSDGATAALYDYTPHFSGNENFDTIFTNYFGDVFTDDYGLNFYAMSNYPTIAAGQSGSVWIEYQNTGDGTFFDDNEASVVGAHPLHLADSNPINRTSNFYDSATWLNNNRPSTGFAAVYNSDGTTLATDQDEVEPGQIVKFAYNYTPPIDTQNGTYQEYIQPVLEGAPSWNVGGYGFFNVTVTSPPYRATYNSLQSYPSGYPGQKVSTWIRYTNTGTQTWYDDTSVPNGGNAVHLADTNPINRVSPFYDSATWINDTRPSNTFGAVYNSDGQTLASNQNEVAPGQIVQFNVVYNIPVGQASGTYSENIEPVLEGASDWEMGGSGFFNVNVKSTPSYGSDFYSMSNYPTISPGSEQSVWIEYQNTGSQPWYDDTSVPNGGYPVHLADTNPINRVSAFYDSASWLNNNRPSTSFAAVYKNDGTTLASNQNVATTGQIVKFQFNYAVPNGTTAKTYQEYIQPVLEHAPNWQALDGYGFFDVIVP